MRPSALGDEAGFTLIEALVSTVVMLAVLFALYAFFDAGVRLVGTGEDRTEASAASRLALQRIERELKAASPYDPSDAGRDHLFFRYESPETPTLPGERSIAFGNDLDGRCGLREVSGGGCSEKANAKELVAFYVNGSGTLVRRANNGRVPLADGVKSLRFVPLDREGNPATEEAEVRRVEVAVTVGAGEAERTLTTSVAPRSRAG
ncbi:Hypothetical Protein RradSPS_1996 [Rubrobacter radiotolerans]|uniref:Prepilin-type N-terminal cleavage/methylation domain n=1 Tax=Rubrobacter radiotolerans TaxID=42256 RepID=A0A023X5D1_RUBRA|nr:hypothetical protein [Rubrobacter radiotolerans]AHY47279.1 Hypothetical Protein RradSPS_1996 [Rubrobacter radiotolerans]MDX5894684.1 hypothetical protein [Rubrobacter radiotolerans]SMC06534.1 prepilin-type cleavage/methylation-like protein [Rubrobacter radiotolerans DSM 5868]